MTKKEVVVKTSMKISKAKAIHEYCLQCGDGSFTELRDCHLTDCPLFPYRFGAYSASAIKQLQMTYNVTIIK